MPARLTHSRLSGIRHLTLQAILGFLTVAAVAGCCGSTPSHYCDFKAGLQDAAPDNGKMSCYGQTCVMPEVCCFRKVTPYASCVDVSNFEQLGCMKPPASTCAGPNECAGGQVCCLTLENGGSLSCKSTDECPGAGLSTDGTAHLCASDNDCKLSQTCIQLTDQSGAGLGVFVCN